MAYLCNILLLVVLFPDKYTLNCILNMLMYANKIKLMYFQHFFFQFKPNVHRLKSLIFLPISHSS